jgi:mono/diheme cytochrome c family protein
MIVCVVLVLGLILAQQYWLASRPKRRFNFHRETPQTQPPSATPSPDGTTSASAPPQGFYITKDNQKIFVNYGTPDPLLQTFMRSVMSGNYDASAKGREIFLKICAACHQPDGGGKEGVAPPLVGSEWVLAPSGERLVRIVLNGLNGPITVRGKTWNQPMLPWRENLTDEQIAVVLNFIRSQLGDNKAAPISPELVATARQEKHTGAESAEELLRIQVH